MRTVAGDKTFIGTTGVLLLLIAGPLDADSPCCCFIVSGTRSVVDAGAVLPSNAMLGALSRVGASMTAWPSGAVIAGSPAQQVGVRDGHTNFNVSSTEQTPGDINQVPFPTVPSPLCSLLHAELAAPCTVCRRSKSLQRNAFTSSVWWSTLRCWEWRLCRFTNSSVQISQRARVYRIFRLHGFYVWTSPHKETNHVRNVSWCADMCFERYEWYQAAWFLPLAYALFGTLACHQSPSLCASYGCDILMFECARRARHDVAHRTGVGNTGCFGGLA